jgi:hypothetical protein
MNQEESMLGGGKPGLRLAVAAVGLASFAIAASASAAVKFERIDGFNDPATPDSLDRVGC